MQSEANKPRRRTAALPTTAGKNYTMTAATKCEFCGVGITAITYRLNDGACACCRDIFHGLKGRLTVLGTMLPSEVEQELPTLPEAWATGARRRWDRVRARMQPGDELRRLSSDVQTPRPVIAFGVVWRRDNAAMSGLVLRVETLVSDSSRSLPGERMRLATDAEIQSCATIREQLQPGDHAIYFENNTPESIVEDGRAGLVLLRNGHVELRVRSVAL